MSNFDVPFRSGAPSGSGGSVRSVQDVMARAQRLVDTPWPAGGHSVGWHVEALHVGDLTAIAVAALRASGSSSAPSAH